MNAVTRGFRQLTQRFTAEPVCLPAILSDTPLAISQRKGDLFLSSVQQQQEKPAFYQEAQNGFGRYRLDGEIAVIGVVGALFRRPSSFDSVFGFTSYQVLSFLINKGLDDSQVKGILLDVDSFGGELQGLFDLNDEIREARKKKPIWSVINDDGLAAGYLLASVASRIYATRTALTGSVGILARHLDQSAFDAKEGLKWTAIFAGKHKNDFSPHQPLSEEAKARLQKLINQQFDLLTKAVAQNRGLSQDFIKSLESKIFFGAQEGMKAGLVDREAKALSALIARIKAKNQSATLTKQHQKEIPCKTNYQIM